MKKPVAYLLSICCGFTIVISIWTALFYFQLGLPTKHSYWTNALVTNKFLAAHNLSENKMVFVAGSSGNFNIDAERITSLTGIQSLNLGTHAILPLEYMLDHTKKELHHGDTVVLALEYLYYAADERLSDAYIDYLLARDSEYFKDSLISEKIKIMSYVSLKRLLTPIKESFIPSEPSYAFNVYSEFFYSEYGDSHSNNLIFLNKEMRDQREAAPPEFRILSVSEAKNNWSLLKNFSEWCKNNDIAVIAVPPATMKFDIYKNLEYRESLAKLKVLYEDAGINFIGDPYSVMFDRSLFFDTNYHGNHIGKRKYTDTLVNWLTPYLADKPRRTVTTFATETPVDKALRNFNGWMPVSGLRPLEGPYPERNLPVVAWGAPQTKLKVVTDGLEEAELHIEFIQNLPGQTITILVDDVQVFSRKLVQTPEFQTIELKFPVTRGAHEITIKSNDESSSDTGISLLYRAIRFTPAAMTSA